MWKELLSILGKHVSLSQSRLPTRVHWLDTVRGFAIIAVVLGHANIGLIAAGLTQEQPVTFQLLNTSLYLVHMPLFAFLFGLNIPAAWEKRKSWGFVVNRVIFYIYLYLVWTLIQGLFEILGARYSNGSTTWLDVLNIVQPLAHLWYLQWMIVIFITLVVLRPWQSYVRGIVSFVIFNFITWFSWGADIPEIFQRGFGISSFALAGALIGTARLSLLAKNSTYLRISLSIILVLIYALLLKSGYHLTTPTLTDPLITVQSKMLGMVASVVAVASIILIFSVFSNENTMKIFQFIGINSLQIYLMHLLITPPVRIVLVKLGFVEPWVILMVSVLLGVGLPLLLCIFFSKQTFWLFNLPNLSKKYKPKHLT